MNYLKGLLISFLIVFFANHILPGIEVTDQTKLPHIGGDLIFSFSLGLLNSAIYPGLKLLRQEVSALKIALIVLILNFIAYALVKFLPIGVQVMSVEGYFLGAAVVAVGSFTLNYLEMKRHHSHPSDHTFQ